MSSQQFTNESYVTLATNDNYAIGALTLAKSLRLTNTQRMLTVLITSAVSAHMQDLLRSVFDHVHFVNVLNSEDKTNLALLDRPELGITFTKLHCWRLVQFTKCVFLDADTLVLNNVDDLFDREEFSAATDVGWPDCFNSGVFVYKPNKDTYAQLLDFAVSKGSFDGGDQGLLNMYFHDWHTSESSRRLPFVYNMTTNVSYSYAPAFKQFFDNIKIVHFIGAQKPWYYRYNMDTNTVTQSAAGSNTDLTLANKWWSTFVSHVLPMLSGEIRDRINCQLIRNSGSSAPSGADSASEHAQQYAGSSGQQYQSGGMSSSGVVVGSDQHQNMWERGQIEYKGRDSFSNIQAHLDYQIEKK